MENFGYVMATKMLVNGNLKVRYMYRDLPDNIQDSGWRFFCGKETDEYVNNPDNIAIYDVNTIIALDDSIVPYLNSASGASFERTDDISKFNVSLLN